MILQAQTISSLVSRQSNCAPIPGYVHSAFERTVNLLCGRSLWLSLHPAGVALHPFAVVAGQAPCSADTPAFLGAQVGERVEVGAGRIVLGKGRVSVRLDGALLWNPAPGWTRFTRRARGGCLADTILDALEDTQLTSPFLLTGGQPGSIEGALIHKCRQIKKSLKRAWVLGDIRQAARVMRRAVGLGPGLTPSGDDFLMGFLGAADVLAHGTGAVRAVRRSLCLERSMTTLPSYFMLRGALAGLLPEPLTGVLRAIADGSPGPVRSRVRLLAGLGAASGQDMLAGVICYLEASDTAGKKE